MTVEQVALIVMLAVVVIAMATAVAPRLNVAGPLILAVLGIAASMLPIVPSLDIDPDWILVGVLPPLLYAAAVRLPALEFRRDVGHISGLAFLLVLITSVALAALFWLAIPGLDPALALAIGAILSPTDAVATSIARRSGISRRVVTMLEGESLLNDATALVLLRTAVASAAVTTAATSATSQATGLTAAFFPAFAWGALVAIVIGSIVGYLNLRVRALIRHSAATTAMGFVVPFVAYLPTEQLGGSGLVAAVVAGIITGQGAARWLTPDQRRSDELNWRTIELVLEGAVFLVMGLEMKDIVGENIAAHAGLGIGAALAGGAFAIIIAIRAMYVAALIRVQQRRARGRLRRRIRTRGGRLDDADARIDIDEHPEGIRRADLRGRIAAMRSRVAGAVGDLGHYRASPLEWRHGAVIVWAGMRGVVTLAAAQTLPRDTPERSLLVFVAFAVAIGSLIVQGLTLPWLVRMLHPPHGADDGTSRDEQARLDDELRGAAASALTSSRLTRRDGTPFPAATLAHVGRRLLEPPDDDTTAAARMHLELRLALIEAMRSRLTVLSRGGAFSTEALRHALAELDADQLSVELRLDEGL